MLKDRTSNRIPDRIAKGLGWAVATSGVVFTGLCLLLAATLSEPRLLIGAVFGLASAAYGFEVARREPAERVVIRQPARLAA